MASYADKIPTFNPYVAQLPVEAMVKVGMQKQQQYDEGLQKIQTTIDNVAGMDLAKDVHKKYLQSKLNQLGNDLTWVAAGDFSNFQLVNSVNGMTNQITKDEIVQNAVSDTAAYRKQLVYRDQLKKEGKTSPNREFDFNRDSGKWLNNDDLKDRFNATYVEHTDVNKKVLEVIDKLHPGGYTKDIVNAVNKDGSINYGAIADSMHKQGVKEVSEEQIKVAVNSMLDAKDRDELASQGRYNYQSYTPDDLTEAATFSYNNTKKDYTQKLTALQQQLLTTSDLGQQEEINNSIAYYEDKLGDVKKNIPSSLDATLAATLENIVSNPDGARASLYTENYLSQIANGFKYREVTDEVLANPIAEYRLKVMNHELDQIKESNEQAYRRETLKREDVKIAQKDREIDIAEGKTKPGAGNKPTFKGSGDASKDSIDSLYNQNEYLGGLSSQNESIVKSLTDEASSATTKANPRDILKNIQLYRDGKFKGPLDVDTKAKFDAYIENSNTIANQNELRNIKEDEAYRELTGDKQGSLNNSLNKQLSRHGNVNVKTKDGIQHNFTSREIYNFLRKEKWEVGGGQSSWTKVDIDPALLTPREKILYNAFKNRYGVATYADEKTTGNKNMDAYIGGINRVVGANAKMHMDVTKKVAEKMAPYTGGFGTDQASVRFKDGTDKNNFISDLVNIAEADLKMKTGDAKYKPEEVISSLNNKNADDVKFNVQRTGDKYYINVVDVKNSKDTKMVPVSEDFIRDNPSLGDNYTNKNLDLSTDFLRNAGTTNVFKDYKHAKYHTGLIGGILPDGNRTVTIPVAADLNLKSGNVYATFRLKTKTGELNLQYPFPVDESDFKNNYLPSLTNDKIIKLFKTQYPNIENLIQK
jgi:hypothetical protein